MLEQSVIVWDLETIPDLAAAARMLDPSNAPEAEVREALGSSFPKHPLHKIACVGALIDLSATVAQCPLYPQKRTLELSHEMSALCQKRTFCAAERTSLFDHLVGGGEQ
jgi:hypothetical protein